MDAFRVDMRAAVDGTDGVRSVRFVRLGVCLEAPPSLVFSSPLLLSPTSPVVSLTSLTLTQATEHGYVTRIVCIARGEGFK